MQNQTIFKSIIIGCLLSSLFFFTGCMPLFQAVAFPNQCKKCTVYQGNEVVYVNEGCGGSNVRIEEDAKVAAYDLSRSCRLSNFDVRCTTWREEPVETTP